MTRATEDRSPKRLVLRCSCFCVECKAANPGNDVGCWIIDMTVSHGERLGGWVSSDIVTLGYNGTVRCG